MLDIVNCEGHIGFKLVIKTNLKLLSKIYEFLAAGGNIL